MRIHASRLMFVFQLLAGVLMIVPNLGMSSEKQKIGSLLTDDDASWALVSGEVVSVDPPQPGRKGTISILRVYSGPQALKSKTIVNYTGDEGSNDGSIAMPLLKKGETGFWILARSENTGDFTVVGMYRKAHTRDFDWKTEWAEEIERLVKLKAEQRLQTAKVLCQHKNPEIARLGVEVLFGAYQPDAEKAGVPGFLTGLAANKAVSHAALVRADELFLDRDGKKWEASEARKALLNRFTEVLSEADAPVVALHMLGASHRTPAILTKAQANEILGKIAENPKQSRAVRKVASERLFTITNLTKGPDPTFDILIGVFKVERDEAARLDLAKGFASLPQKPYPPYPGASFSPDQIRSLRELLKAEPNADVRKSLQAAIDGIK